MEKRKVLKSGELLVSEVEPKDIFIPEEYDEEQKMIAQTCKDFLETEVYPDLDNLDKGDRELMLKKLKSSGELGLMGISIPRLRTVSRTSKDLATLNSETSKSSCSMQQKQETMEIA